MSVPSRPTIDLTRGRHGLVHRLEVLRVMAHAEFKLKYAGSALGYAWSFIKPLLLFTMLYLVFGRVFKLGLISAYYSVSLLMGIVLFNFLADATSLGMHSLVAREALLRKLVFPRTIIPTAATMTAAITFLVNLVAIAVFVAWNRLVPQVDWLLILPLLAELYLFILGLAFILAALCVRFRDVAQVWELALQLFFYASPVIYPIGYLPPWARQIAFVSPFTQVMQDVRALVIYPEAVATAATALGSFGRLIPVGVALATLALGLWLFRREEPSFAERM